MIGTRCSTRAMGPVYRDTGRRAPPTQRNRGSMSTVTTIGVVDLLTIRGCIEILGDRRTGRERTPTLPPAVVDYLGATHVRPRAWTDEAKDLLRQALIAGGSTSMQAGRSETAQMLYLMHLLEFHPRISIGQSHFISRFPTMYSGGGSTIASHLSTAARYVSEGRSCRPGWDGIASFLIEPNFAGGHLDDRNQDAPINNLDWRSTPFANCIH